MEKLSQNQFGPKLALAEGLALLRAELFGDRGACEMARRLGIPPRTWYNYEDGVTVPGEVVLKIITLTSVEAPWLLYRVGPKFRGASPERAPSGGTTSMTIDALIRTALELLEQDNDKTGPALRKCSEKSRIAANGCTAALAGPSTHHHASRALSRRTP